MGSVLFFLFFIIVVQALLLSIGIGIGYLLRWLIPSVEIGTGILIGVVSTIASTYLFMKISSMNVGEEIYIVDDEDEEDNEPPPIQKRGGRENLYPFDQFTSRRRRKRRK